MPQVRLSMRKVREILRLRFVARRTQREIGLACRISSSTVWDTLRRFKASGLGWPLPDDLTDEQLEARLYPSQASEYPKLRPVPDWEEVHLERRKAKNVTLNLLWEEYKKKNPDGYEYSWFCDKYRTWLKSVEPVMRQTYRFGDKCLVDYAGETVPIIDSTTGEVLFQAQIFVGTLGASNYTYAEAQASQQLQSWIMGHVRMFDFFGGRPEALIPDNLRAGVKSPCFYDPDLNPTYAALAKHYEVAVIPARARKPRDKAKAENAVLQVERRILARLRNRTFFELSELNEAISKLLEELNERPFQKLAGSRRELFEAEELPQMRPLPKERFSYVHRKGARVGIDYHVEYDHYYYSVPYGLVRHTVEVLASASTVEILHDGVRVASHRRGYKKGGFSTDPTHRHPKHRWELEWTPKRLRGWASKLGENVELMVTAILNKYRYPEQGFRRCLGLLKLEGKYGQERLDAACRRGLAYGALSYQSVKSILKKKLDGEPLSSAVTTDGRRDHKNVRGPAYYA